MTIQRNESELVTLSQMCRKMTSAIKQMSPKAKAELRVQLRKNFSLPERSEPLIGRYVQ
jgi:hypothetical protein